MSESSPRGAVLVLLGALLMVIGGGALARCVQTSGGRIDVSDIRFEGSDGSRLSALLYVPSDATPRSPAPGILAIHGYINSRETQSGFAIEFARRGYVVLSLDQTGHGYSDPPAFARGFGGPDGLRYLRSLDVVDPERIGLEGHSMGGWAVLMAASELPDGYRSTVLVGSSSGSAGAPAGTASFPRNLGLVFSVWDEFSALMWDAPVGRDIVDTPKLRAQFGTDEPVEIGRLYGSIEAGTARRLYMPLATHPQDHLSGEAIGDAVEWIQRTLPSKTPRPAEDQIWHWKEAGTLVAFLGALLGALALADLLLRSAFFRELREEPRPAIDGTGRAWWIHAMLALALPAVTYFPLQILGARWIAPSTWFPQELTTGIMVWALGNALLTLLGLGIWHVASGGTHEPRGRIYGLRWESIPWIRGFVKSALLALALAGFVYGLLLASHSLYVSDFRFWIVALKPPGALHAAIFARYALPFAAFFFVASLALHTQLRPSGLGLARELGLNVALLSGGIAALLLVQYIPLVSGRPLPLGQPLLTVVALQFVPLLAIVAVFSTYLFRRTGHVYAGALFNTVFVTGYIVAGQATHVAL